MSNPTTSPEPTQGEPHPALRLAEAVAMLVAAIAGPSWFWCLFPAGRALRAQLQQMSRDFSALMQRLAAGHPTPAEHLPAAPSPAVSRPRAPRPAADPRPKSACPRRSRRPQAARAPAVAARAPFPAPPRDQPFRAVPAPRPPVPWPRAGPAKPPGSAAPAHADFVTISN